MQKKDCYLFKFALFSSPFYSIYSEICVSKAAIASSSTRYGYRTRVGSWIFYSCHLFLGSLGDDHAIYVIPIITYFLSVAHQLISSMILISEKWPQVVAGDRNTAY
jgi:hypothetical protein